MPYLLVKFLSSSVYTFLFPFYSNVLFRESVQFRLSSVTAYYVTPFCFYLDAYSLITKLELCNFLLLK